MIARLAQGIAPHISVRMHPDHRWSTALSSRVLAGTLALLAALVAPVSFAHAQERGAAELARLVDGLGVSARVLVIAAHPDDEDTQLIAWLARGRHVETAYLSLTRGDGGQNLIGDELGEALGVIRSEELLAARRVDGGRQYFSRAYDFGFSKTAAETFEKWPREAILGDVVRIVRQFRPHVIVSIFSGTARDGHGHHQAAGVLAREAYEVSGDATRFPESGFGVTWTPAKFYRSARFNPADATLAVQVGEYDPILGRSYAEVAGASRSQHRSQGFGSLERRGPSLTFLTREASRVGAPADAESERSIFDGIDTTWARFGAAARTPAQRSAIDSMPAAAQAARQAMDFREPAAVIPALVRIRRLLDAICTPGEPSGCAGVSPDSATGGVTARPRTVQRGDPDLHRSHATALARVNDALIAAAGITVEAESPREVVVAARRMPVAVRVYNQGTLPVMASLLAPGSARASPERLMPPGTVYADSLQLMAGTVTAPWWLAEPRRDGVFASGSRTREDGRVASTAVVQLRIGIGSGEDRVMVPVTVPVVRRFADAVRGDVQLPVVAAPAITLTLDREVAYAPAGRDIERVVRVRLRSADPAARTTRLTLELPAGLRADSAARDVRLPGPDTEATVAFTVRGQLAAGRHVLRAVATSGGERFTTGYQLVDYEHVRPQRLYRPAELTIEAVEIAVPVGLTVAYVRGVSDNVAPMLEDLGLDLTLLAPADLATADLSRFGAVVLGPRVYESSPQIAAATPRLLAYTRQGGTLVVQYQQFALNPVAPAESQGSLSDAAGLTPYPFSAARPILRVTVEEAPVRIAVPDERLLTWPNRIGNNDFDGWVQERSLYMPHDFDPRYRAPLEMNDPGEASSGGALLIGAYGEGSYVYTTLSLFRQLPAGVPGAARLFVNLLSAGGQAPGPM